MRSNVFKSVFTLTVMMLAGMSLFSACTKESDPRDQFIGSYRTSWWYVHPNGQEIIGSYTLTIVKSSTNPGDIILNNILGFNESVRATVNGTSFTIPQQTILDGGISGSGTIKGNVIDSSVQLSATGSTQINYSQTSTKQ